MQLTPSLTNLAQRTPALRSQSLNSPSPASESSLAHNLASASMSGTGTGPGKGPDTTVPAVPHHYLKNLLSDDQKKVWEQVKQNYTNTTIELVQSHAGLRDMKYPLDDATFQRLLTCASDVEQMVKMTRQFKEEASPALLREVTDACVLELVELTDRTLLDKLFDLCGAQGGGTFNKKERTDTTNKIADISEEFKSLTASLDIPGTKLDNSKIQTLCAKLSEVQEKLTGVMKHQEKSPDQLAVLGRVSLQLRAMEYRLKSHVVEQLLTREWNSKNKSGSTTTMNIDLNITAGNAAAWLGKLDLHQCWQVLVNDRGGVDVLNHKALGGKLNLDEQAENNAGGVLQKLGRMAKPAKMLFTFLAQHAGIAQTKTTYFDSPEAFIKNKAGVATALLMLSELKQQKSPVDQLALMLLKAKGVSTLGTKATIHEDLTRFSRQTGQALQRLDLLKPGQGYDGASGEKPSSPIRSVAYSSPFNWQQNGAWFGKTRTNKAANRLETWLANPALLPVSNPAIYQIQLSGHKEDPALASGIMKGEVAINWLAEIGDRAQIFNKAIQNTTLTTEEKDHLDEALAKTGRMVGGAWKKAGNAHEGLDIVRERLQNAMITNYVEAKWIDDLVAVERGGAGPFRSNPFEAAGRPMPIKVSNKSGTLSQRTIQLAVETELKTLAQERDLLDTTELYAATNGAARTIIAMMATHVRLVGVWQDTFPTDKDLDPAFAAKIGEINRFLADPKGFPPENRAGIAELDMTMKGETANTIDTLKFTPKGLSAEFEATIRHIKNNNFEQTGEFLEISLGEKQTLQLATLQEEQKAGTGAPSLEGSLQDEVSMWLKSKGWNADSVAIPAGILNTIWPEVLGRKDRQLTLRFAKVDNNYQLQYARKIEGASTVPLQPQSLELPLVQAKLSGNVQQKMVSTEYLGSTTLSYLQTAFDGWQSQHNPEEGWAQFEKDHEPEFEQVLQNLAQSSPKSGIGKELEQKNQKAGGGLADNLLAMAKAWNAERTTQNRTAALEALTQVLAAVYPLEQQEQAKKFTFKQE